MRPLLLACLLTLGLAPAAGAQHERQQLGRRLKAFDTAWEAQPDAAARKRALAILPKASQQFLGLQLGEAGRTLDEARHALTSEKPRTALEAYYDSVDMILERPLVAPPKEEYGPWAKLRLAEFYQVPIPDKPILSTPIWMDGGWAHASSDPTGKRLPKLATPGLYPRNFLGGSRPAGHVLTLRARVDGSEVVTRTVYAVDVPDLPARLAKLKAAVPKEPATIEAATFADRVALLEQLASDTPAETEYPAAALFEQAEALAVKLETKFFTLDTPGLTPKLSRQQWLTVPTAGGQRTPCRVMIPTSLDPRKPVPVVVALHGAGGSENLFFEGYGRGHVVRECRDRGWVLVAPRSSLFGAPPVDAVLAALKERYPLDLARVFLVGHSMGAAQAVELAQQKGASYKGLALLGGGGRVRSEPAFATLPVFIGVGSQDFALGSSKKLRDALTKAGAGAVTYREYPDLEHLTIVREALPDVFRQWDALAK